jgi:ABC-2 type transport system ATP-binding protein
MPSAISFNKVSLKYGNKPALKDVSFKVNSGSIYGFLGPNGAGKTTTIRCLMNFITADSGSIKIYGKKVDENSVDIKRDIGYLASSESLYPHWRVADHLIFASKIRGLDVDYSLSNNLDLDINAKIESLSTGNKQKVMIALAFIGNPKLLVLDEPTRGLDPILQNQLYDLLIEHRKSGGTVFMSSHNLPEVEKVCDSVAVIKDGQIVVEETIESIRAQSIHEISVNFKNIVDKKLFDYTEAEAVSNHGTSFEIKVKGDLNKVLELIHKHPVSDLTIEHASLEEIFLEMYK